MIRKALSPKVVAVSSSSDGSSSPSSFRLSAGFDRKEVMRCMMCGGKDCAKCGADAYKKLTNPGLPKLHSHWITDEILAMQRPSEAILRDGVVVEMVKKKITAVFNLCEPGEHPFCGTGNLSETGFPYQPETLMSNGSKTPLAV